MSVYSHRDSTGGGLGLKTFFDLWSRRGALRKKKIILFTYLLQITSKGYNTQTFVRILYLFGVDIHAARYDVK